MQTDINYSSNLGSWPSPVKSIVSPSNQGNNIRLPSTLSFQGQLVIWNDFLLNSIGFADLDLPMAVAIIHVFTKTDLRDVEASAARFV
jgi:hypothetical protein